MSGMFRRSLTIACAAVLALGCDRGPAPPQTRAPGTPPAALEPPAPPLPQYEFAAGLREQYPQVTGFIQQFLLTCLAGDYAGYRALVSRYETPESEERFNAIYRAVREARIETIEPLEPPARLADRYESLLYLVVADVVFDPQSQAALRRGDRQFAILAFRERGAWRMAPAPSRLQPDDAQETPATAPASQPSYPWDEDEDG